MIPVNAWDVVVVGAGAAGSAAARVLARAGRRVLMVDRDRDRDRDRVHGAAAGVERRVGESLPAAARPLLTHLGLLDVVDAGPHVASYGNVSAWGAASLAATDFVRGPHGLGWHLDRPRFDADLRDAVRVGGAAWQPGHVRAATPTDDGWHLAIDTGDAHARWIIDATGRGAAIARRHGATRTKDDALVALAAWARPADGARDQDSRTLVEAAPHGWWYTSRLPDGARVAVLHADLDVATKLVRSPGAWHAELARTSHVRQPLAGATWLGPPRALEACGARLDRPFGRRWIAAGDAALSFDPLSSQGIFNALYSGMKAGEAASAALDGDAASAARYVAQLEAIRATYRARHRAAYAAERRWADHPFWRSRAA